MNYLYLIILLMGLGTSSCKQNQTTKNQSGMNIFSKKEKTFEWMPTECAPKLYPIEIIKGALISDKGKEIRIPSGATMNNGWGQTGSAHIVGDDFKLVPSKLEITWMSFAENKFYTGTFNLPKDKMIALFEEGFVDRLKKKKTYTSIIVGMAPGGVVSVWMLGGGKSVEIEQYQAEETDISMEVVNPSGNRDRNSYVATMMKSYLKDDQKKQLEKQGITYGKWTDYRKKYTWKSKFEFEKESIGVDFLIHFFNGENLFTYAQNPILEKYAKRVLPKYLRYEWEDMNKNHWQTEIYFDEKEITKAFEDIFSDSKNTQAELVLKVDKYNSNISLLLDSQNAQVPITKSRIETYEFKPDRSDMVERNCIPFLHIVSHKEEATTLKTTAFLVITFTCCTSNTTFIFENVYDLRLKTSYKFIELFFLYARQKNQA